MNCLVSRSLKGITVSLGLLLAVPAVAMMQEKVESGKAVTEKHECACKDIKEIKSGWCDVCDIGVVFELSTSSKKIYGLLVGAPVPAIISCTECATAAKEDGICESCHVGIADGHVYYSMIAYTLAKGQVLDSDKTPECSGCAKAVAAKHGYCDDCDAGIVANRLFAGKEDYQAATHAYKIAGKAVEAGSKCEDCAAAMLTDGECEHCQLKFEGGKKIG